MTFLVILFFVLHGEQREHDSNKYCIEDHWKRQSSDTA